MALTFDNALGYDLDGRADRSKELGWKSHYNLNGWRNPSQKLAWTIPKTDQGPDDDARRNIRFISIFS